jgi:hypothetical protein
VAELKERLCEDGFFEFQFVPLWVEFDGRRFMPARGNFR